MSQNNFGELFNTCVGDIESAYRRLGHTLGWRFVTGPKATFSAATEVALISLNPGGSSIPADHPSASSEAGSSYVVETWAGYPQGQAPLQRQVQSLIREIMFGRGDIGSVSDFLATRVLTAHFVPFRSPSLVTLPRRTESIEFGRALWSRILAAWRPRLLVTIDREAYTNFAELLTQQGGRLIESESFPTGWGNYTAEGSRFEGVRQDGTVTILRLPHLSRFTLFSEPGYSMNRKAHLTQVFEWIIQAA